MSHRERFMTYVVLGMVVLGGFGLIAYEFLVKPLRDKDAEIARLEADIDTKEGKLLEVEGQLPRLATLRKISLPMDKSGSVIPARVAYEVLLGDITRNAGFVPGSVKINPAEPDTKTAPTLAQKKPAYTKLTFTLQARTDLHGLVDFLRSFYKEELLHQIRKITVQRPIGNAAQQRPGELTVDMTIEALVVDNAEKRTTLKPEQAPKNVPKLLARADGDYDSIPGKNIFFGPAPAPRERPSAPDNVELADYLYLTDITSDSDHCQVGIFDRLARRMYVIRCEGGKTVCERFDFQGGRWRAWEKSSVLVLKDESGGTYRKYQVVKVGSGEVFLRPIDEKEFAKRAVLAAFAGAGQPVRAINEVEALLATPERMVRWTMDTPLSGAEAVDKGATAVTRKTAEAEAGGEGQ